MNTIVAGSNKKLVAFYTLYLDILGVKTQYFNDLPTGIKQAGLSSDIFNIVLILDNKKDYLDYSKLKVFLDEDKRNVIIIYTNDVLLKLVTSSKVITYSHKDVTRNFASSMSKIHVCEPYMRASKKDKSPEKVLDHIKYLLTKGNIILPVKNECAVNVLSALDNDEVSFKKIDAMTKMDPILHSCIIKMAKSVFYSANYADIENVEKALVRVGITNVKVFLINYINKSLLVNRSLHFVDRIEGAVDTSQKIASLCYVLTDYFEVESSEVMFSIGLLSRLGEIFILAAISGYLDDQMITEEESEKYLKICEQNMHTVGGMMLKKWKFSENYYTPILNYAKMKSSKYMEETKVLHLAECMLPLFENKPICKECADAIIVTGVELDDDELMKIRERAMKHFETITSFVL